MRGQISFEYLLLTGLIMLFLAPIFYYSVYTATYNIKMNEASNLVKSIADTADILYSLGPDSQNTIEITMPSGVQNMSINNTEVLVVIQIFKGVSYIGMDTKTNISGNISTKSGTYHITLKNENNTIKVTSGY